MEEECSAEVCQQAAHLIVCAILEIEDTNNYPSLVVQRISEALQAIHESAVMEVLAHLNQKQSEDKQ